LATMAEDSAERIKLEEEYENFKNYAENYK
jgi:hypothetical protein